MIKLIRTDKNNYFFDDKSNEILKKYDPDNNNLVMKVLMVDGSNLFVPQNEIVYGYGAQISFQYNKDKYIIDDGYQDLLIRCGYLVLNNYDSEFITDREVGLELRNNFLAQVASLLSKEEIIDSPYYIDSPKSGEYELSFNKSGYEFTVYIDTVNNIVNKNQQRKVNSLPFYQFIKNMDKYGTLYLSIFCKKIYDFAEVSDKYNIAEAFIINLMNALNDSTGCNQRFRYENLVIVKRINHYKGI